MILVRSLLALAAWTPALPAAPQAGPTSSSLPTVTRQDQVQLVSLPSGELVRRTRSEVTGLRALRLPGSEGLALVWEEVDPSGRTTSWYALSLDGQRVSAVRETSYAIAMELVAFDPLDQEPDLEGSPLTWDGEVHLVQFHTQVLAAYRTTLEQMGARVHDHLANHALIVRMTPSVRAAVEALEVVRWVGPFRPELRLEPELLAALRDGELAPRQWYNVAVYERGLEPKRRVAAAVAALGGAARAIFPEGFRFEVELTPEQLVAVMALPDVAGLDRWGPAEIDLDVVRQFSGADALEVATGFSGQGVRGECCDTGIQETHAEFQHDGGVLLHGPNGSYLYHGTQVAGVVFGGGVVPKARGILPQGKIVFARYDDLYNGTKSRYTHTAELLDPAGPYRCVFQTNSWGSPQTSSYTTVSQEMDDILFLHDIVITQSQSNTGSTLSRPQAWAKNIVAVGGVVHNNTVTRNDDSWGGASIGPATDGRIKPDLAHFYDGVYAASDGNTYSEFGGTSNATPCTVGHFGLFFQMWHNNVWNNNATGATVFDSRPSARLARAALINTAGQWAFSGAAHNLTRTHQGWGAADVEKLYETRNTTFWVDETDPVDNLGSRSYQVDVAASAPELKVTLVYRDPKAVSFAGVHRINDLSLRVTSPGGTVYWGNYGLKASMWSVAGGSENHLDVVENVFVQDPEPGAWTLEVLGTDVNTDVVPGVPGNNADFALWATGVEDPCPGPGTYCTAKITSQLTLPAIGWTGTTSQAANDLVVTLDQAVPNKNGIPFWGVQPAAIPFQGGTLCAGGNVTRGPLTPTDGQGAAAYSVPISPAMIGTTRYYQWWFRDPQAAFGSGLSDGLAVTFCP
jgi:hypothetical protein